MHRSWKLFLLLSILGFATTPMAPARALPLYGGTSPQDHPSETNLFEIYDTLAGTPSAHTSNADLDPLMLAGDDTMSADFVILIATNASYENDLGFYTGLSTGNFKTPLFFDVTGKAILGPAFDAEPLPDGDFGLFLSTSEWDTWHSEADAIDAGSTAFDHMVTYVFESDLILETDLGVITLANARLIGWEDLADSAPPDADYNDLIVVTGTLVPEPESALLVGLGLAVLAARGRSSPGAHLSH